MGSTRVPIHNRSRWNRPPALPAPHAGGAARRRPPQRVAIAPQPASPAHRHPDHRCQAPPSHADARRCAPPLGRGAAPGAQAAPRPAPLQPARRRAAQPVSGLSGLGPCTTLSRRARKRSPRRSSKPRQPLAHQPPALVLQGPPGAPSSPCGGRRPAAGGARAGAWRRVCRRRVIEQLARLPITPSPHYLHSQLPGMAGMPLAHPAATPAPAPAPPSSQAPHGTAGVDRLAAAQREIMEMKEEKVTGCCCAGSTACWGCCSCRQGRATPPAPDHPTICRSDPRIWGVRFICLPAYCLCAGRPARPHSLR